MKKFFCLVTWFTEIGQSFKLMPLPMSFLLNDLCQLVNEKSFEIYYTILFDTLKTCMYISCFTVSFILIPWLLKCCVKTKCSK